MKWTKLVRVALAIVAMSAIPLFAQNGAQNTDDEIKALEKELRVLELQHKIEQYKSGAIPSEGGAQGETPQNSKYSKEPSGFMLGAGIALGGTIEETDYHTAGSDNYQVDYSTNYSRLEYGGELLLGYKWMFGESGYFGMRLYGRYEFLFSTAGLNPVDAHNGSLNLDLLFNFNRHRTFKAGLILGLNFGVGGTNYANDRMCGNNYDKLNYSAPDGTQPTWEACEPTEINLTIGGNLGFRFVIYDKNAIELIVQPRLDFVSGNTQVIGLARYIYTF